MESVPKPRRGDEAVAGCWTEMEAFAMRSLIRLFPMAFVLGLSLWLSARPATAALGELAVSDEQLELGQKVFTTHCKSCHMEKGKSRIKRLNLSDDIWMHGAELAQIEKTVADGIEASQMQPFKEKLTPQEIEAVARYVKSLSQAPASN